MAPSLCNLSLELAINGNSNYPLSQSQTPSLSAQVHSLVSLSPNYSISPQAWHPLVQPPTKNFLGFSLGIPGLFSVRKLWFLVNVESGGESKNAIDEAEKLARGEITLPDQFRYLTKEAPDLSVRWPWFVDSQSPLVTVSLRKVANTSANSS